MPSPKQGEWNDISLALSNAAENTFLNILESKQKSSI